MSDVSDDLSDMRSDDGAADPSDFGTGGTGEDMFNMDEQEDAEDEDDMLDVVEEDAADDMPGSARDGKKKRVASDDGADDEERDMRPPLPRPPPPRPPHPRLGFTKFAKACAKKRKTGDVIESTSSTSPVSSLSSASSTSVSMSVSASFSTASSSSTASWSSTASASLSSASLSSTASRSPVSSLSSASWSSASSSSASSSSASTTPTFVPIELFREIVSLSMGMREIKNPLLYILKRERVLDVSTEISSMINFTYYGGGINKRWVEIKDDDCEARRALCRAFRLRFLYRDDAGDVVLAPDVLLSLIYQALCNLAGPGSSASRAVQDVVCQSRSCLGRRIGGNITLKPFYGYHPFGTASTTASSTASSTASNTNLPVRWNILMEYYERKKIETHGTDQYSFAAETHGGADQYTASFATHFFENVLRETPAEVEILERLGEGLRGFRSWLCGPYAYATCRGEHDEDLQSALFVNDLRCRGQGIDLEERRRRMGRNAVLYFLKSIEESDRDAGDDDRYEESTILMEYLLKRRKVTPPMLHAMKMGHTQGEDDGIKKLSGITVFCGGRLKVEPTLEMDGDYEIDEIQCHKNKLTPGSREAKNEARRMAEEAYQDESLFPAPEHTRQFRRRPCSSGDSLSSSKFPWVIPNSEDEDREDEDREDDDDDEEDNEDEDNEDDGASVVRRKNGGYTQVTDYPALRDATWSIYGMTKRQGIATQQMTPAYTSSSAWKGRNKENQVKALKLCGYHVQEKGHPFGKIHLSAKGGGHACFGLHVLDTPPNPTNNVAYHHLMDFCNSKARASMWLWFQRQMFHCHHMDICPMVVKVPYTELEQEKLTTLHKFQWESLNREGRLDPHRLALWDMDLVVPHGFTVDKNGHKNNSSTLCGLLLMTLEELGISGLLDYRATAPTGENEYDDGSSAEDVPLVVAFGRPYFKGMTKVSCSLVVVSRRRFHDMVRNVSNVEETRVIDQFLRHWNVGFEDLGGDFVTPPPWEVYSGVAAVASSLPCVYVPDHVHAKISRALKARIQAIVSTSGVDAQVAFHVDDAELVCTTQAALQFNADVVDKTSFYRPLGASKHRKVGGNIETVENSRQTFHRIMGLKLFGKDASRKQAYAHGVIPSMQGNLYKYRFMEGDGMNIIQSAVTSPLGYRHPLHHTCGDDTNDMMDVDAGWDRPGEVLDDRKTQHDYLLELVTSRGFLLTPMNLSGQDSIIGFSTPLSVLKDDDLRLTATRSSWDNVTGRQPDGTYTVVYEWGQGDSQGKISRKTPPLVDWVSALNASAKESYERETSQMEDLEDILDDLKTYSKCMVVEDTLTNTSSEPTDSSVSKKKKSTHSSESDKSAKFTAIPWTGKSKLKNRWDGNLKKWNIAGTRTITDSFKVFQAKRYASEWRILVGFNFSAIGLPPLPVTDQLKQTLKYYVDDGGEVVQWNGEEAISALDAVIAKAAGEVPKRVWEPRRAEVEEMIKPTVAGWNNVNMIGCNNSQDDVHDSTLYYSLCHRETMRVSLWSEFFPVVNFPNKEMAFAYEEAMDATQSKAKKNKWTRRVGSGDPRRWLCEKACATSTKVKLIVHFQGIGARGFKVGGRCYKPFCPAKSIGAAKSFQEQVMDAALFQLQQVDPFAEPTWETYFSEYEPKLMKTFSADCESVRGEDGLDGLLRRVLWWVMGIADGDDAEETYDCGGFLSKRLLQLKNWRDQASRLFSWDKYDAKKDCEVALEEFGYHIDVYRDTTHYKTLKKQRGKQWASALKTKSMGAASRVFEHHRKVLSEEGITDGVRQRVESQLSVKRRFTKKKFQTHLKKMYRTVVGVVAAAEMAAAGNETLESIVRHIGFENMKKDIAGQKCEEGLCTTLFPTFNAPGKKRGRFCCIHRSSGMTSVVQDHDELWTRWVEKKWACWHEYEKVMCNLSDWTWRMVHEVGSVREYRQSSLEGQRSPWAITSTADLAMWTIYDTFTTTGTAVDDLSNLFRNIVNIATITPCPPTPGYNVHRIRNKDYTIRKLAECKATINKGIQMDEERGRFAGEAYYNGSKMLKHGHFYHLTTASVLGVCSRNDALFKTFLDRKMRIWVREQSSKTCEKPLVGVEVTATAFKKKNSEITFKCLGCKEDYKCALQDTHNRVFT